MGDNAYKLQLLGDMAISATFNIGDLSPYVDDCFEDPLDFRSNSLEEWEVNAQAGIQESFLNPNQVQGINQAKEDQGKQALIHQIHSLFSCSNLKLSMVLDGMILGVSKMSYGQVLPF